MSLTVKSIIDWLEALAPSALAESWDNVGLLVGDAERPVSQVMTCLTLTEDVADEAIAERVDLVISHHPLPFRPLARLTTATSEGRVLWKLIGAQCAVASAHTAFDSAQRGINQQWAERLELRDVRPLVPTGSDASVGAGRMGLAPSGTTLASLAERVAGFIGQPSLRGVGDAAQPVKRVAIACGSGGSLLAAAAAAGCDVLVTGEATFHSLLEARSQGVAVLLTGHYASERFAMQWLAERLAAEFLDIQAWASRDERDPLQRLP